jgi:hypothetical protein
MPATRAAGYFTATGRPGGLGADYVFLGSGVLAKSKRTLRGSRLWQWLMGILLERWVRALLLHRFAQAR